MKLQYKISLVLILCISLSFLPLLIIVQNKMTGLNREQTESFSQQLVFSKGQEVGNWLYQRVCELRIISLYDEFQKPPGSSFESMSPYIRKINERVESLFGSTSQTFMVVNKNGIGWSLDGIRLDVSDREYFLEALALDETREYSVSRPLISRLSGERSIIICYPVRDSKGEKISYILGNITTRRLDDIVSSIRYFNGSAWLMDRYGRILSEDQREDHSEILDPDNLSLTKTAVQLQKSNFGSIEYTNDQLEGKLLFASVPFSNGWRLCLLAENHVIYEKNRNVQTSIIVTWVLLLILTVISAFFLSHYITNPLQELMKTMAMVEGGDLSAQFASLRGKDEISQLGGSFNQMVRRIDRLIRELIKEQKEKRLAEFKILQAQIKPHFLYNTLDTIQWKALEYGATEVGELVNALSQFFRISLSGGDEMITLDNELENAYHYLYIQQYRYRDKLDFDMYLQEDLRDFMIPKILLQPLIENAIYHGIKPLDGKGKIEVNGYSQDGLIILEVKDNGVGMDRAPDGRTPSVQDSFQGSGIGLQNIRDRLRLTYGDSAALFIHSSPEEGTTVVIQITKT